MQAFEITGTDAAGATRTYYGCSKCEHTIYRTKESAEGCCSPMPCPKCGKEMRGVTHWVGFRELCDDCGHKETQAAERVKEAARFDHAEKLTEWNSAVFCDGVSGGNDGYFRDMDELLDALEDHDGCRPEYAWACDAVPVVQLDYDDIIENATQEAYEDFDSAHLDGRDELVAALAAFNKRNEADCNWHINYKKAVLIPPKETEPACTPQPQTATSDLATTGQTANRTS